MTNKIQIDGQLMRKIAKLSRLQISAEEEAHYAKDLQKILDYVELLNQVDTKGVEPLIHGFPLEEHFREDIPVPLTEEESRRFVQCSQEHLYDQYRVPQVIGGD